MSTRIRCVKVPSFSRKSNNSWWSFDVPFFIPCPDCQCCKAIVDTFSIAQSKDHDSTNRTVHREKGMFPNHWW